MALTVDELITELKKYDENKKVRVLFGMPTPILWLSHEECMFGFDWDEGCTIFTSDEIKSEFNDSERLETVGDLLWHLQFFKKDAPVGNHDLCGCSSYIEEVSDEIKDLNGEIVSDTVFLINFAHMVG